MHSHHSRMIQVSRQELIDIIEKNKANHIKEYGEAVKAYRAEAKKQLRELNKRLKKGDLKLGLYLITPVNQSEEYDKVIKMFKWEKRDLIEISQAEFNEYFHDETDFARSAKMSNLSYLNKYNVFIQSNSFTCKLDLGTKFLYELEAK